MLFSCREGGVTPSAPRILLDNESGIYTTKAGRQITVSPEYENADEGAVFSWVLESGEELSSAPVLEFVSDETGRFYVSLTVSTDGGMDKADIRIDVLDLTPPEITLPGAEDGFVILQGSFLELKPAVASSLETSYRWSVDGKEVSTEPVLVFEGKELGDYALRLETANEDGSDAVDFTVSVKSPEDVDFSWTFLQTEYNMSLGRRILLRILDVENAFDAVYTWYADGKQVQYGERTEYIFSASEEGQYSVRVEMRNSYLTATKSWQSMYVRQREHITVPVRHQLCHPATKSMSSCRLPDSLSMNITPQPLWRRPAHMRRRGWLRLSMCLWAVSEDIS